MDWIELVACKFRLTFATTTEPEREREREREGRQNIRAVSLFRLVRAENRRQKILADSLAASGHFCPSGRAF